jgi:hypothetical protein
MKLQPTSRKLASSGITNTVSFGIKEDGFAHIFNVLRNQLYSNKYMAVLREYAVNGVDSHIEAGCPERPIEVSLPTQLSPNLKIRDFGSALTDTDIHNIYAFYGESTKRNTNSQTGMLGIGSKSAFAYGDNFVINSYIDGKKHTYNAFIDPSQVGQIAKMGEEDTDEEDGVEIVIPTKEEDVNTFTETASQIFQWFKVRPIIKGQPVRFDDRTVLYEGDNWKWRKSDGSGYGYHNRHGSGEAIAVMGNIGYPIDFHSLNYNSSNEDYRDLENLCHDNLVLGVEIGDMEISASREQLQYTDHTNKNIIAKLKAVKKGLIALIKEKFDGCETMFEAKCLVGTIDDMTSGLYNFRELINKNIAVNGVKVETDQFWVGDIPEGELKVQRLGKTQRSNKFKVETTNKIDCKHNTVIIVNDEKASRGLMNRLLALAIEQDLKPYLVTYIKPSEAKKALEKIGFDAPVHKKFSELPTRKLNEFDGYGRSSTAVSGEWKKDEKHSSKVFEADWGKIDEWQDKHSSYWTKQSVDFDNESGLYVIIDRFQANDAPSHRLQDLRSWQKLKKVLEHFNIELPKVVGVKSGSRNKVEGKEGWENFFKWLPREIKKHVDGIQQIMVDSRLLKQAAKDYNWAWDKDNKHLRNLLSQLAAEDSTMRNFYAARTLLEKTISKSALDTLEVLDGTLGDLGIELKLNVKPSTDLKRLAIAVEKKYTMIEHMDYAKWNWQSSKDFTDDLANYINIIDVCDIKQNSKRGS